MDCNQSGGQGEGVSLLNDEHRLASDIKLLGRSVRERWPVADDVKRETVDRLREIINKRTVDVMTKEGPEPMDGPADSNAIAAARVLTAMVGQNQKDEHHDEGKTVHHAHEHVLRLDAKRTRLLAVAERLGIAVDDGGSAGERAGVVDQGNAGSPQGVGE